MAAFVRLICLGVEEGGLDDQHVDAIGELEDVVAQASIHDESHLLARSRCRAFLEQWPRQLTDRGAGDAVLAELLGQKCSAVGFGEAVAVGRDAVGQRECGEGEAVALQCLAGTAHRVFDEAG